MISIILVAVYALGLYSACHAIMQAKSAAASIAWFSTLLLIPFISLPLYWTFGHSRYLDYSLSSNKFEDASSSLIKSAVSIPADNPDLLKTVQAQGFISITGRQFRPDNQVSLLIDGQATYTSIHSAIDSAMDYVLIQFYTIKADEAGLLLKDKLLAALHRGVTVYLMYDEIGSIDLPDKYLQELASAGAGISRFSGRGRWFKRFKLNFRNHRKNVVVDGVTGFIGGLNISRAYLGKNEEIGPWRDTHIKLSGPIVLDLQEFFLKDWFYGTEDLIELEPRPTTSNGDLPVMLAATGPYKKLETCSLLFTHCINSSYSRLWISTPYFVPDETVLSALKLAALRGVDVRVIVPKESDTPFMKFTPYFYLDELVKAGVKFYWYLPGFVHQKVMLSDNKFSLLGTANLDNRSLRLNFEATAIIASDSFAADVAQMLEQDLDNCIPFKVDAFTSQSWMFRFTVRFIRLFAPIL